MSKKHLVAGLLPLAAFVHAQTALAADETIKVIGRSISDSNVLDIPANIKVITAEDIEASGATDLSTLLRGKSGIEISDTNSGPVFSMRGFGANGAHNTLILVDGRKLNKFDLSKPQIDSIPLNNIAFIEISSASAGVLYGDQAVGGVINIITKAPTQAGGTLGLEVGSFDTRGGNVSFAGPLNDDWSYYVSGSQKNSKNYRDHNDSRLGSILGRIQFDGEGRQFFAESSYYDNTRFYAGSITKQQFEENPRQANAGSGNDYSHEMTFANRIGLEQQLTDGWILQTKLISDQTKTNGYLWSSFTRKLESYSGDVQLENSWKSANGNGKLLLGIDAAKSRYVYSANRGLKQNKLSLYSVLNLPLSEGFSVTAGGRSSKVEDNVRDSALYPQGEKLEASASAAELGVNYQFSKAQRVYARIDQNFRFAKIDEQAYTSPGVFGLKPQRGTSLEFGWSADFYAHSLSVNLYRLDIKDEIIFDSSAPTPINGSFQGANVNADKSRRDGANINWTWNVTQELSTGLDYSYIDAKYTAGKYNGNRLPWVSTHSGNVFANYMLTPAWNIYAGASYSSERYVSGDKANQIEKSDAYWLGSLSTQYRLNDWSLMLSIENVTDERYSASTNSWGGYYPGDGRRATISANYDF
ncbi:TonB-dependent receptor family protein [Veronia pacifica]|uniref:TonB-dependent receptor n=1 Tax=Veronia pacifica TaxID=1080227 RepID=A0A1C3EJR7_9GAMM|nr:TonB-dependent receptor [Veronia pacifica]ODA33474.1 hypothetical protein A8L45_10530 [Veronia pacifica]